jgi:mannan endo-1,4-beta-mannosidase
VLVVVLGILLSVRATPATGGPPPAPLEDFVHVVDGEFQFDGLPLHVTGTNCYYLMVYAADSTLRPRVDEVLTKSAALGLTVIRTWGFNDGSGWNALQTSPGVYDETVFRGLDYVLDRCRDLGLRVVLPLVNNWADYGGMDQYVAWSATATAHDDFYTDADCRAWYKNHATTMVSRVNTLNGITYGDDPTIFAWELANEPRCPSDKTGNTLVAWIEEMSAHLKSVDPNHMVSVGCEGFYDDSSGPWYLNGWEGVDFIRDHQVAGIDYAGAHSWPDGWSLDLSATMALLGRQIADARDVIGKPFMLGEFGKHRDGTGGTATRDIFFGAWFDSLLANECGGSSFWILYDDAYPDYDGYGVYYPADTSTVSLIAAHAGAMTALGRVGVPDARRPAGLALGPASPNPFTESSRISFTISPESAALSVSLIVVDVSGRLVRRLVDGPLDPGPHDLVWDGRDTTGRRVPPGAYFYILRAGNWSTARKTIYLR